MTPGDSQLPPSESEPPKQLTCFVVIGFGRKTDYATGRMLDLDKTYEQLIRPAFDAVNVNCFRAIDANRTGGIDDIMYRWLYDADMVVADLSTLNANVFYELGVRHAQKPNTTIIIAESVLMEKIPFDLSHFVIHQYRHGGEDIAEADRKQFVEHLSKVVSDILEAEELRKSQAPNSKRMHDSPIYSVLQGMTPPEYKTDTHLSPPKFIPPEQRAVPAQSQGVSLASTIDAAEKAKNAKDFAGAITLFQQALEQSQEPAKPGDPKRKPDIFLAQRLALVTYKYAEQELKAGKIDLPQAMTQMEGATNILEEYCAPALSTDPETLGLSGAIKKRQYDLTQDATYLEDAIRFYERGFYVKQDYYNGINVAFMYTRRANLLMDEGKKFEAVVSYGHGNLIRKKVADICADLRKDGASFGKRGDKVWVLMSEAEAYRGMGQPAEVKRLEQKIAAVPPKDFETDAYNTQQTALEKEMAKFEERNPLKSDAV